MAEQLVSMALSKEERKEIVKPSGAEGPRYPWGLRVSLDNDALEKLGLTELPEVGSTHMLVAVVKVTSVSANDHEHGKHRSVDLQIIEMCLEDKSKKRDLAKVLYPEA